MDDLEKIDRLFSLKEKGALSDTEFQQEKHRILSLEADLKEQTSPQPNDDDVVYHDTRQSGYNSGSSGKIIATILILLVTGLVFWVAKQNSWLSNAPNIASDDTAQITENSPTTPTNKPRSAKEEPERETFQWFLAEDDGRLEALFGMPTTSANFSLTCLDQEGSIEFNEYEIERPAQMTGEIGNDQGQTFRYTGEYREDGLTVFGFNIPASNPMWKDIAAGSSKLQISPDGSQKYSLPRSPNLSAFVVKCLSRSE